MGGEGDPLRIVQEIEIWLYEQVVHAQTSIFPGKWDTQSSLGVLDTNGSPNICQMTRLRYSQEKREHADYLTPVDYNLKWKESENDQHLARELKETMKNESEGDAKCDWCTWNDPQKN